MADDLKADTAESEGFILCTAENLTIPPVASFLYYPSTPLFNDSVEPLLNGTDGNKDDREENSRNSNDNKELESSSLHGNDTKDPKGSSHEFFPPSEGTAPNAVQGAPREIKKDMNSQGPKAASSEGYQGDNSVQEPQTSENEATQLESIHNSDATPYNNRPNSPTVAEEGLHLQDPVDSGSGYKYGSLPVIPECEELSEPYPDIPDKTSLDSGRGSKDPHADEKLRQSVGTKMEEESTLSYSDKYDDKHNEIKSHGAMKSSIKNIKTRDTLTAAKLFAASGGNSPPSPLEKLLISSHRQLDRADSLVMERCIEEFSSPINKSVVDSECHSIHCNKYCNKDFDWNVIESTANTFYEAFLKSVQVHHDSPHCKICQSKAWSDSPLLF